MLPRSEPEDHHVHFEVRYGAEQSIRGYSVVVGQAAGVGVVCSAQQCGTNTVLLHLGEPKVQNSMVPI